MKAWIAERERLNDYAEYRNGHQMNRASLIAADVLKRSQLSINGNPRLRKILIDAEKHWYGEAENTEVLKIAWDAQVESSERSNKATERTR